MAGAGSPTEFSALVVHRPRSGLSREMALLGAMAAARDLCCENKHGPLVTSPHNSKRGTRPWRPSWSSVGRGGGAPSPVGAVLGPVAADRHRAPRRRAVLGAVEERIPALPASLQPPPLAGELRLVQDAQQGRDGTVHGWPIGFQDGPSRIVDGDPEPSRARRPPDDARRRWVRVPCLVGDRERSDRFPELAEPGGVRGRDPNLWAHESLVLEPGMGLLRGSQPVPFAGEVVVVGVDEPLQRRLASSAMNASVCSWVAVLRSCLASLEMSRTSW